MINSRLVVIDLDDLLVDVVQLVLESIDLSVDGLYLVFEIAMLLA